MLSDSHHLAEAIVKAWPSPNKRVFNHTQLMELIEKADTSPRHLYDPRLPHVTSDQIVGLLLEQERIVQFKFDTLYRCGARYIWGDASPFEVLLSLRPKGYASHGSAAWIHQLNAEPLQTVYWNDEQSPKPRPKGGLTQSGIDKAFQRRARQSTNRASYGQFGLCILSGKSTNHLAVVEQSLPDGLVVPVTDVERTLIDITVRPEYAGGPRAVLACYARAAGCVSVNRLLNLLDKLDYVYPYHQAIGFYLDRSGAFSAEDVNQFRAMERSFDFYLTHQMELPLYCGEWRVYYPSDI